MKASELIEALKRSIERFGDKDVRIQVEGAGKRFEQCAADVHTGPFTVVVISKEAMDADPLNALPVCNSGGDVLSS